jgi:hypothetical protein
MPRFQFFRSRVALRTSKQEAFRRIVFVFILMICDPSVVAQNPVSQGLIAVYTADSWRPADSFTAASWLDLSGSGNHVTDISGSISVERPVGAPAYIRGNTAAWMKFPVGILPSANYTLFFVARYDGGSQGRIFQGLSSNWLSGFWRGQAGVAHHGDACGWITGDVYVPNQIRPDAFMHGFDWVMGTDRSNSIRSNGVDRTSVRTTNSVCASFDRLAINTGPIGPEPSDWAIQSIHIYSRKLTDAEVLRVEAWLAAQQPSFTPANLQARAQFEVILNFSLWHGHIMNPIFKII